MRRLQVALAVTALVALGGDQALIGGPREIDIDSRWDTRLRLFAVQPALSRDSERGDALRVDIPSFGQIGRAGDVYLPIKTYRIAIPEGTGPVRIEAASGRSRPLAGVELAEPPPPGERLGTEARAPGRAARREKNLRAERREARGEVRPRAPTGDPVRLGDIGYLRDQRFVEVVYTPVVAPEGGGEALFYPEIELDLVVEGILPGAIGDEPAPADPRFEETYRKAFLNYDQGRYFRAGSRGAASTSSGGLTGSESATSGLAAIGATGTGIQGTGGFPDYKLTVTKDGLYRLTQPYLLAPGTGVAPGLAGADPREFKIVNRGVEIPIFVQGESDGVFDSGDYIEFYGQRLDGPETQVNYNLSPLPSIYQLDDYGDSNVYWLIVDNVGTRVRAASRNAPPNGGYTLATDFQETIHTEVDSLFQPTGGDDPFLMAPRLNSNNGSVAVDANSCVYVNPGIPSQVNGNYLGPGITDPNNPHYCPACRVSLPGINTASGTNATISVRMRGTTDDLAVDPDHLSVVEIDGVAARSTAACWSGLTFFTQSVNVAHGLLSSSVDIRIEQPGILAVTGTEQLLVDYSEVSYRRLFQALNDGLKFTIPDANRRVAVSSLTTNSASQVSVYEITKTTPPAAVLGGPAAIPLPVRVTGGTFSGSSGNFTLTFSNDDDPNSASDRTYVVAGPGAGGFQLPASVTEAPVSTLLDATNEADVLVIGDPNLMDPAPSSPFTMYWNHRESADGFVVKIVSIDDVSDVFGYGIKHPEALRSFLDYAFTNWKGPMLDPNRPPPSYAALVGDFTADPKNNLNRSDWVYQVPSFLMLQASAVLGFYVSDNYIAAFRGADQLPDIHLGRISIRTPVEADTVFTKLLSYDSPPAGTWKGRGIFITDEGKSLGESAEFERITNIVADTYWNPKPPHSATKLYYDEPAYNNGGNPGLFKSDILAAINGGASLVTYTGHGAFSIWGNDGFFTSSDVASLTANGKYFFGINENCLSGGFHFLAGDALSEAFLKANDKGSVAFLAPAGLSFSFIGEFINDQIYGDIFSTRRGRRFGDLVTDVRLFLGGIGAVTDMQSYTLVGDPTQNFALPAPKPPVGLMAAGGNAQATLTWSPGPDPVAGTYIYRAQFPGGPYTRITPAPVPSSPYVDPNLTNAQTYYYYASSVDAEGFEGAIGNFNTDCVSTNPPASGPDCVWATPLNPNPPSTPAGAEVHGDGSGSRLVVSWIMPPENDLDSFIVEYGTAMGGPYPSTATANKNATSLQVTGLVTGTTYYMRLKSKNTSGLQSAPTGELKGVPLVFEGESPPKFIADLYIEVTPGDANSLTLSWSKPSLDIYGGPTTVVSYELYRESFPGFVPAPSNRIAVITDPNQTSYIDTGAAAAPSPYFYLLGATDNSGLSSGLGFELPTGVSDLFVDIINGGTTVSFDWTPVTMAVDGTPASVAKYQLYSGSAPIPRTLVDSLTPVLDNITTGHAEMPLTAGQDFFTLIVVDTKGNKSPF